MMHLLPAIPAVTVPRISNLLGRCVLLHGLFEVWGYGHDQEEAAEDATRWDARHSIACTVTVRSFVR